MANETHARLDRTEVVPMMLVTGQLTGLGDRSAQLFKIPPLVRFAHESAPFDKGVYTAGPAGTAARNVPKVFKQAESGYVAIRQNVLHRLHNNQNDSGGRTMSLQLNPRARRLLAGALLAVAGAGGFECKRKPCSHPPIGPVRSRCSRRW